MAQGHKIEFKKTNEVHGEVYLDGEKLNRVIDFSVWQDGPFQRVVLVLDPSELHIFDKPKEAVAPFIPSESSARDVAGYSAKAVAQDIRKALQRLSDETGGMSAEVEVDWQEYQFIESDTTRAFLDRVTVKTGSVRATV